MTGRSSLTCGVLLFLFLALGSLHPALAQDPGDPVPQNERANTIFQQGLDAFEAGEYETAYRRFQEAYEDFPLHRRTTAALLMAGKALYRDGRYEQADQVLTQLLEEYPTSGYLEEAERVRGFARQQQEFADREEAIFELGVLLPMGGNDAAFSQALFNGIRMAIDEFNASGELPVRLVFRDTENDPDRAQRLVEELAHEEDVDAIVGPLYSREAQAAGAAAEEAGVVLIAPLATDEAVSEGRQYVFQANPTISMRGRLMARQALRDLRINNFGIIAEYGNDISERMAEGFQQEVMEQGGNVAFYHLLENSRGWAQLPEEVGTEQLEQVEAIYMPISGGEAPRSIRNALNSLDQVDTPARILGNAEWHDRPIARQASRYVVTYTNDFYVDEENPTVQDFVRRYREQYGETPDQLTFTARRMVYAGYDLTRFLVGQRINSPSQPLDQALRQAVAHDGLGTRLDFNGSNVNQLMFYHYYRGGQIELLR